MVKIVLPHTRAEQEYPPPTCGLFRPSVFLMGGSKAHFFTAKSDTFLLSSGRGVLPCDPGSTPLYARLEAAEGETIHRVGARRALAQTTEGSFFFLRSNVLPCCCCTFFKAACVQQCTAVSPNQRESEKNSKNDKKNTWQHRNKNTASKFCQSLYSIQPRNLFLPGRG